MSLQVTSSPGCWLRSWSGVVAKTPRRRRRRNDDDTTRVGPVGLGGVVWSGRRVGVVVLVRAGVVFGLLRRGASRGQTPQVCHPRVSSLKSDYGVPLSLLVDYHSPWQIAIPYSPLISEEPLYRGHQRRRPCLCITHQRQSHLLGTEQLRPDKGT